MKLKAKHTLILLSTLCTLSFITIGCSSSDTPANTPTQEETPNEESPIEDPSGSEPSEEPQASAPDPATEATEGRWHVLSPEVAAIIDADFEGTVWKLESDTFYIAEKYVEILEDGSIVSGGPSSNADIPDSDLIQVLFDEDTHFYLRTIQSSSETHEDTEATFQDLEPYMTVELKGSFTNDIFHATEIRLIKVEF